MKEIKDDINRWINISSSLIGKISRVKRNILSKAIYRLNAICIKLLMVFFRELEKNNFTICMEIEGKEKKKKNRE